MKYEKAQAEVIRFNEGVSFTAASVSYGSIGDFISHLSCPGYGYYTNDSFTCSPFSGTGTHRPLIKGIRTTIVIDYEGPITINNWDTYLYSCSGFNGGA